MVWYKRGNTQSYIVNCGCDGATIENVDGVIHGSNFQKMKEVAERVENFLDRVDV